MKMSLIPLEIEIAWIPLEITEISPVDLRREGRGPRWENGIAKPGDWGMRDLLIYVCFIMFNMF